MKTSPPVLRAAVILVGLLALGVIAGAVRAAPPRPLPPPLPPPGPPGKLTTCTTTGPPWAAWGIHTPNAPPRRGNKYQVTALGVTCSKAKALLKVLTPKIPPNQDLHITGPEGFKCKSRVDGLLKNRLYQISCTRLKPAAMFWRQPFGGKVG